MSSMPNVVVKDSHLTYGGVSYFRGHAEEVELGSIGEKRTPLTKMNYLEVKDRIPIAKLGTAKSIRTEIDFNATSSSAFNTLVRAIIKGVPVQLQGDATFNKLRSGELDLLKFSILNNQMMTAVNNSPQKLDFLANWGSDARIAHQVFVVVEAAIATKFDNNVTVNLSASSEGVLEATVGGTVGASGSTTVRLSAGTCFAYLLLKIDWNNGKTRVEDLDDDQWSLS
jgi:hypothetical protein